MRSYHQFCPIARAAEVLAQRWTPIILRNLVSGASTFTELVDGAPGLSRTLLTTRLRELEAAGVVTVTPNPGGRGNVYGLTEAGHALEPVLRSMGDWAEEFLGLDPESSDPGFLLHNWCAHSLAADRLPARRVVVRFDFVDQHGPNRRMWVIFDGPRSEVCVEPPGHPDDLVVTGESTALAQWHVGRLEWGHALRSGRLDVTGPRSLARALPTWNARNPWATRADAPG